MTYQQAYQEACRKAFGLGQDHGIEKQHAAYGGFSVFMLPRPEHRCGHELRCEVVSPELARAMRRPDGTFAGGGS
jgi:hypothetical protein